jgi:DNA-binding LacI/PurR family transcriptional regulator
MAQRSTILDVANRAGVGKVTVSYVLNGQAEAARISKATIDKVNQAAIELNYRPNAHARNLATNRANAIGIVFQYGDYFGQQSSFITEVLQAVCQACVEADVDVTLHTRPTTDPATEANHLSDGRVDAVILIRDENDPVHQLLLDRNFPAVLFFCRSEDQRAAYVSCDNYNGGRLAVNHLLSLGHRRIAMIRGSEGSVDSNDRFHGYMSALESAGIPYNPNLVITNYDNEKLGKLLDHPERPTAIFSWSDDSAMDAIRFAESIGISVPTDLSVIGFDGTIAGEKFQPAITSIRQPIEDIARTAVKLALELTGKQTISDTKFVLPPSLVTRKSTAFYQPEFLTLKDKEVPTT